jgi:glycosyltransferase involved in cell wall biosynthesis
MRIAIVTHNVFVGDGQGRVNFELTKYLLRNGYSVDLIADAIDPRLENWGAKWIPLHPTIPGLDQPLDRFLLAKVWRFHQLANRILAENEEKYDIIFACGRTLSIPHSVNAVHFVHDAWLKSDSHPSRNEIGIRAGYQWLFSRINARWEIESLRNAKVIIAVSNKVRGELIEAGVPPNRIETVTNGVDLREFRPGSIDRSALGLPIGVPLALFAGDIRSNRKNLDTVLHALKDVTSMHLAVAGTLDGSPYPAMVKELGMASRVHFLGFRQDMPDLMRAADIFTFPSRYEACTLALLEALASGLPVITAQTTGGAEIITDDCGTVLEDPNDVSELVSALRRIIDQPGVRRKMQSAARSIAEKHSWEQMASQYADIFQRIKHYSTT